MPGMYFDGDGIKSNPLHAWIALRDSLRAGRRVRGAGDLDGVPRTVLAEIPAAVADYLLAAAEALLSIRRPGKDAPELVAEALGLEGRNFSNRNFSDLGRDQWESTVFHQVEKLRRGGLTLDAAVDRVADEEGCPREALRERYRVLQAEARKFKKAAGGEDQEA